MRNDQRPRDRLPKWVQDYITQLERNVAHLEAERAKGPEDSNTFRWNGGIEEDLDTPLGHNASIRFRMGERWDERIDVRLKMHGDQLVLDITSANGRMAVLPAASNHIMVISPGR